MCYTLTGLDDLKVYQLAENLEMEVHELTKSFHPDEKYTELLKGINGYVRFLHNQQYQVKSRDLNAHGRK